MTTLETLADNFAAAVEAELTKTAAKKTKKSKKKHDPKAKVRNRGAVCFPAETTGGGKDRFPINNEKQARNALARCMQYDSNPPWHKGSLKSLQEHVRRCVHKKYPSIEISKSKKKKAIHIPQTLFVKYDE